MTTAPSGFTGCVRRPPARAGFSLVEMVIVLVLAGVVSTAAIGMFSTQNRVNAAMTALGESQENARSAVQVAAAELRSASGGSVMTARGDRLVVRIPIVIGIVCSESQGNQRGVYFPMDGRVIDFRRDVTAYDALSRSGAWSPHMTPHNGDAFRGSASRSLCIAAGNGTAGVDADYATMMRLGGAWVGIGTAVRLMREVTYAFETSALTAESRAFTTAVAGRKVELALGFSPRSRFEYQLLGESTWRTSVTGSNLSRIRTIRLRADVEGTGSSGMTTSHANFAIVRDVPLRNAQ